MPDQSPPSSDPDRPITASERASLLREFDEQRKRLNELSSRVNDIEPSEWGRREWLQTGGALGVGALLGGGAAAGAVGTAAADASTGDSDGDVGTPSNRYDMFADGVDAISLNTTTQFVDDGSNVQSAINAVETAGGGTVYITGDVTQSATWEIPDNVVVEGVGFPSVTSSVAAPSVRLREATGESTQAERESTGSDAVRYWGLKNLDFQGNSTGTIGLLLMGGQRGIVDTVRFEDYTSHGIEMRGINSNGGGVYYNVFQNVRPRENGGYGWHFIGDGRGVNDNYIVGGNSVANDIGGWLIDAGTDAANGNWIASSAENNGGGASPAAAEVVVDGGDGNRLDIYIESNVNSLSAIEIKGGGARNRFDGYLAGIGNPEYILSNAGIGNMIFTSLRMDYLLATNGVAFFSTLRQSDIKPFAWLQSRSGRPVEILSYSTDAGGNYQGINTQVKDWDGTDYTMDEEVVCLTMFGEPHS